MIGTLLVAHGSRRTETEETMKAITSMVRAELPECLIEECYMEFHDVNVEKGLLKLMEAGATEIKVVPYFLFAGIHIHEDIPGELAAFQEKHPEVNITMGNILGADQRIAMVLADRVREMVAVG